MTSAKANVRILSIDVGMKNLAYCLFECDPLKLEAGEIKTPESMMQLVLRRKGQSPLLLTFLRLRLA